jgi:NAD(P)-dependent dehydrogenase (short-subunit alcohol dehydrogenase family)
VGIPACTDHLVPQQVEALIERVRREQGRLDVLLNDISEGEAHEWKPFWKLDLYKGLRMLRNALDSHIITSRYAAPLMIEGGRGRPWACRRNRRR